MSANLSRYTDEWEKLSEKSVEWAPRKTERGTGATVRKARRARRAEKLTQGVTGRGRRKVFVLGAILGKSDAYGGGSRATEL